MEEICSQTKASHVLIRIYPIRQRREENLEKDDRTPPWIQGIEVNEETDSQIKIKIREIENLRTALIKHALLVGAAFLFFVLASCSDGEAYYRFYHLDSGRWHRDSLLVFVIDSATLQPDKQYDLSIELSTNQGYPYQDLWLRVSHNFTDTLFQQDTLYLKVADKHGKWLGGGAGGLNQLSAPYLSRVVPSVRDSITGYRVVIGPFMNDNSLVGVEKVGLKIIEAARENAF